MEPDPAILMVAVGEGLFSVEIQGLDSFLAEHGPAARIALLQMLTEVAQRVEGAEATHHCAPELVQ